MIDIENLIMKTFTYTVEDIKNGYVLEDEIEKYIKEKYYNERKRYIQKYMNSIDSLSFFDSVIQCTIMFQCIELDWYENEKIETDIDSDYKFVIRHFNTDLCYFYGNRKIEYNHLSININGQLFDSALLTTGKYDKAWCELIKLSGEFLYPNKVVSEQIVEEKLVYLLSRSVSDQKFIRLNSIEEFKE